MIMMQIRCDFAMCDCLRQSLETNLNTITDLLFFHSLTVEQMNNLWTAYLFSINFETLLLNVEALKGLFSSINALATSASYND